MSSRNRIPAALEPYLRLPPETSFILLTSTLGCSVTWLTARFVGSLLNVHHAAGASQISEGLGGGEATAVVLVSWMRELSFWKTGLGRTVGVDAAKMMKDGRFGFVDCFTTLAGLMDESAMAEMENMITTSILHAATQERRVVLVLDNPDVLLALNVCSAEQLNTLVLKLRSQVHSTIAACSADLPLLAAATSDAERLPNSIDVQTAAFIVQLAHSARLVLSVRELDTGAAKDVSGVLTVTNGGASYDSDDEGGGNAEFKEMEALYLVQRDGNAKVFERGSSSV